MLEEKSVIFLRDDYRDLNGLEFVECVGFQTVKKEIGRGQVFLA